MVVWALLLVPVALYYVQAHGTHFHFDSIVILYPLYASGVIYYVFTLSRRAKQQNGKTSCIYVALSVLLYVVIFDKFASWLDTVWFGKPIIDIGGGTYDYCSCSIREGYFAPMYTPSLIPCTIIWIIWHFWLKDRGWRILPIVILVTLMMLFCLFLISAIVFM